MLGVKPSAGMLFRTADSDGSRSPEAVISDKLWSRYFNRAPAAIGSTIYLTGRPYAIVGIVSPGFRGLPAVMPYDLWVPFDSAPDFKEAYLRRDYRALNVEGRLRAGVTMAQASTELSQIVRQMWPGATGTSTSHQILLAEFADQLHSGVVISGMLMALVTLVLFVACANLANLLLAHGASQRQQNAIRAALGASRFRLFRQFLTESILISVAGTALGLVLAGWLIRLLGVIQPLSVVHIDYDLRIDRSVLLYSIFLAFATGIAFGAWPATRACKRDFLADLNASGLAFGQAGGRTPALKFLLVLQIAVAQFLVGGAFVFLASFAAAGNVKLGFDANKDLITFGLLPTGKSAGADWQKIAENVQAMPGVRHATYAGRVPLGDLGSGEPSAKAALPGAGESRSHSVAYNIVGPGYFGILGTRVLAGRDFSQQDLAGASKVVAVNEAAARLFWPGVPLNEVVGNWIRADGADFQVVAVVDNAKYGSLYEIPQAHLFKPSASGNGETTLVVEPQGDPGAVAVSVRQELHRAYPNLEFFSDTTMKENLLRARGAQLSGSALLGALGGLAIALACVGLYGNASYMARYRTKELAVRMALGAQRRDVLWLCVRQSARVALPGLIIGITVAFVLARIASHATPAVSESWISFAASFLVIGSVAMLAMFVPAYRASGMDPMAALRAE